MKLANTKVWTYGAELELGDLDQRKGLPKGFGWDRRDVTMVNSNGIAVDPKGKSYPYGGEINTPPTGSIKSQVAAIEEVLAFHDDAVVNYRSNLHLHIRVPGLKDDLDACKKIQRYIYPTKGFFDLIEPIPRPKEADFQSKEEFVGAMRRFNRRRVSHHTVLTDKRFRLQQEATSMEEFFQAEVPLKKDGTPQWHLAPRCAINMRQLMETDTIEFRHFPGTLDLDLYRNCLTWCRDFLYAALTDGPSPTELFNSGRYVFPKFKKYHHWQELCYRNTVHDGSLKREVIEANIKKILSGKWSKESPPPSDPSKKATKTVDDVVEAAGGFPPVEGIVRSNDREYPEDTPKVFFVRGTSGSGKSTLVYNLTLNPAYEFKPVFMKGRPRRGGNQPHGYYSPVLNLFVVGSYETACGGCDAIDSVDEVFERARIALKKGRNVLMEGLILSGLSSKLATFADTNPVHIFLLNTNIQDCLERVRLRREARGESRELDPNNTLSKFKAALSSTRSLSKLAVTTDVLKNDVSYKKIVRMLGASVVPFNPNIFSEIKGKQK